MFGKHVRKELSAYAHGELAREEAGRVARHLEGCAACREEAEQVNFGIRLAEQVQVAQAPDSLWQGIEDALDREASSARRRAGARPGTGPRAWRSPGTCAAPSPGSSRSCARRSS